MTQGIRFALPWPSRVTSQTKRLHPKRCFRYRLKPYTTLVASRDIVHKTINISLGSLAYGRTQTFYYGNVEQPRRATIGS